jgi:hypothetical protein
MPRLAQRTLAALVVLSLTLGPNVGLAQDPAEEQARSLYDEGTIAYRTANYEEAVRLFESAFERAVSVGDAGRREAILHELQFDLARAQTKAYEIDLDATRLRRARDLLGRYLESTSDAEAERILVWIDDRLAGGTGDPTQKDTDAARPLFVAGAFFVGVGVAGGVGISVAGLSMARRAQTEWNDGPSMADRESARSKGTTGNTLLIVGGAAGGALVVTGLVLLGVGANKRKASTAFSPMLGPGLAGLTIEGRF